MAECCAAGTRSGKRRKTSHSVKYRRAGLFGMWVVCLCVCVPCRAVPAACVSQRNNNRRYDHSSGYWWLSRVASHRKSLGPRPDLFFFFFFSIQLPLPPLFFIYFFATIHCVCSVFLVWVNCLYCAQTHNRRRPRCSQAQPAAHAAQGGTENRAANDRWQKPRQRPILMRKSQSKQKEKK